MSFLKVFQEFQNRTDIILDSKKLSIREEFNVYRVRGCFNGFLLGSPCLIYHGTKLIKPTKSLCDKWVNKVFTIVHLAYSCWTNDEYCSHGFGFIRREMAEFKWPEVKDRFSDKDKFTAEELFLFETYLRGLEECIGIN